MKIAISTVMDSAKSGAWQVIKNILLELKNIDKENEYIIFVEKTYSDDFGKLPKNFKVVRTSITAKQPILNILWHSFILPFLLIKYKADVLHLPWHSAALLIKTKPTIITIHDLTEYRLATHYSKSRMIYRKLMIPISARLADMIIAVSEYTKQDIVKYLKVNPKKVKVVYNAPKSIYKPVDRRKAQSYLADKYNIGSPFILYVGQIQHPNKNLIPLLHAFKSISDRFPMHKLVLVGKKHHTGEPVYKTVTDLNLSDKIVFTGYVPDEDLPYFYNSAEVFVYPSLFEGFGIPVVEAMACGCPVITSNTGALPEIAGDAATLVDPSNAFAIGMAIRNILNKPEKREELCRRTVERAKNFSWRKSTEQITEIYQSCL